jgi:hypothetical protein
MESDNPLHDCLNGLAWKALEDAEFRARLVADPNGALAQEFDGEVPPGFTVEVHEETESTAHLVLPPAGLLTEADLAGVGGGEGYGRGYSSCSLGRYGWSAPSSSSGWR